VYKSIPGLDLWDIERDASLFTGSNPVIAHPPCQQWSKLRAFAHFNPKEKDLAWLCLEHVLQNGGILEHPSGSSFFREAGIKPTLSIDQSWFGFPARKRTYLYFSKCRPLSFPLSFDAPVKKVYQLGQVARSAMTLKLAKWLVACVSQIKE
jgi:hypothetical protein